MSMNELQIKIKELKTLKLMAEELQAEITTIEDGIKSEMTAQSAEQLIVGEYKVRWTTVKSNRVDTTALKKELPEVAARYTKTTESRRFTVS